MMELAAGDHVAFLTQDAIPAHSRWLSNLLSGFKLAEQVALVFGPYLPRPEASHMMGRERRVLSQQRAYCCDRHVDRRLVAGVPPLPGQEASQQRCQRLAWGVETGHTTCLARPPRPAYLRRSEQPWPPQPPQVAVELYVRLILIGTVSAVGADGGPSNSSPK